jgi:hypothetical protein
MEVNDDDIPSSPTNTSPSSSDLDTEVINIPLSSIFTPQLLTDCMKFFNYYPSRLVLSSPIGAPH